MSFTALPFLYQTRTIQRTFRTLRTQNVLQFARLVHVPPSKSRKLDNAIPFEWDHDESYDMVDHSAAAAKKPSTITPSEAEIFKGIFDEIAQGRMPPARKRSATSGTTGRSSQDKTSMSRSIVEQDRIKEFREKFLLRYPSSLRTAAQVALGLYELEPKPDSDENRKMIELDEADKAKWEERAKYERLRTEERERVDALMKACDTDVALWQVMEAEVFSLPARLGILQLTETQTKDRKRTLKTDKAKGSKEKKSEKEIEKNSEASTRSSATELDELPAVTAEEKRLMDIHGPLYAHFINSGLALFDTAFARPSEYAFQILPRVKSLGLPSHVLGVSSPFYTRLARMHWHRFGDAVSALDILKEMNSAGLYVDEDAHKLLVTMRDHLHGCAWGAQGSFVMGMMEAPPYDATLTQRLDVMEKQAVQFMRERAAEMAAL
ncbi:hypothetical protein E4U55_002567 [Claviceps digitariae]|nr:hypothetical protein E4U55_002567 [Claviceps digitariae]